MDTISVRATASFVFGSTELSNADKYLSRWRVFITPTAHHIGSTKTLGGELKNIEKATR